MPRSKLKMKNKKIIKRSIICWLLLMPFIIMSLFPYAVMLTSSLKPRGEVYKIPTSWFASDFRFKNYLEMWDAINFGSSLFNSLYVGFITTLCILIIAIPAAYGLSQFEFKYKGLYRMFLLTTQMLSPIILIIGIFRLCVWLGILDSKNSLVLVYAAFGLAFSTWMLQSYFSTIPKELEESAWIEGATKFKSLIYIFIPLAIPAITVTSLISFVHSWNEFVLALTLMRSNENYTLPLKVFSLVGGRYQIEWDHVMAATFLATVPVAIIFSWLQKYLVQGISLGAIK